MLLRVGEAAGAAADAEALLAEHPLREGAWTVLVEALAGAGRARDALQAYQRAAAVLGEAGLVPSPRLRQAEAAALGGAPGPPAPEPRLLPVPVSSIVGRHADLAAVDDLLGRARVVTLCGPGGVGKTRLALAVAERAARRYRFGARLVALAPLDDPSALLGAVVDALGLSADGGSPAAALTAAGVLDLLVVLDNCEHLLAEAARAAELIVTGGAPPGCWPRAGSVWGSTVSTPGRCRPSASATKGRRRGSCSSTGPGPSGRTSPRARRISPAWRGSPDASTACPWPSRWRRRAPPPCRFPNWPTASTTSTSATWPRPAGVSNPATAPWRR